MKKLLSLLFLVSSSCLAQTTNISDYFSGNGGGLTNLNASSLASGTVDNARLNTTLTNAVNTSGTVVSSSKLTGSDLDLNNGSTPVLTFVNKGKLYSGSSVGVFSLRNSADSAYAQSLTAGSYIATTNGAGFTGNGSGLTNLGGIFTLSTNSTQLTVTNTQNCRGTFTVSLAFDDVTGGNPSSCTIWETNSVFTNFFGTISPNLAGFTLIGTVSVTNFYSFPAQTNSTLTIVDTSSGGAAVRKVIGQVWY